MSKGRRLKEQRAATRSSQPQPVATRSSQFSPGELAVDEEELVELLQKLPADRLPYLGLAAFYLAASPVRDANQCLLASTLLMLAMRGFGITADLVALEVEVPGRTARYGTGSPQFKGTTLNGHVGLIADDTFIDATASQFPEIRKIIGVRPVSAPLGAWANQVRTTGGEIGIQLPQGKIAKYSIHRIGSADGIGLEFMKMQPEGELPRAVQNLIKSFIVLLAGIRPDDPTGVALLDEQIREARGMATRVDESIVRVVPRGD